MRDSRNTETAEEAEMDISYEEHSNKYKNLLDNSSEIYNIEEQVVNYSENRSREPSNISITQSNEKNYPISRTQSIEI